MCKTYIHTHIYTTRAGFRGVGGIRQDKLQGSRKNNSFLAWEKNCKFTVKDLDIKINIII